jgi:ATP-dependent RNA helicase RhlE
LQLDTSNPFRLVDIYEGTPRREGGHALGGGGQREGGREGGRGEWDGRVVGPRDGGRGRGHALGGGGEAEEAMHEDAMHDVGLPLSLEMLESGGGEGKGGVVREEIGGARDHRGQMKVVCVCVCG